jgi:aspartate 1-decarboxylase
MKVRQITIQGWKFEYSSNQDEGKFIKYLTRNEPLIKGGLVIINSPERLPIVEDFLYSRGFCFLYEGSCHINFRKKDTKKILPNISEKDIEQIRKAEEEERKYKDKKRYRMKEVIDKPIRSGSHIVTENDLTILSNINDGAELEVYGNLELFGTVNGKVECEGSYMLIRDIGENGYIIFNGVILDKEKFKDKSAKLVKLDQNNRLVVEKL